MTSFRRHLFLDGKCMPTFKVKGQLYHTANSLFLIDPNEPTFLQIYFVGDENHEAKLRQKYF